MLPNLQAQGLRVDLNKTWALQPLAAAICHDDAISLLWNILSPGAKEVSAGPFDSAPAFRVDASAGERRGKDVTLLPGQRTGTYESTRVFDEGRALYS